MVEIPKCRILEDDVWFPVQERFGKQAPESLQSMTNPRRTKYALSGLARCGVCGGAIGCALVKRAGVMIKAYTCNCHRSCGK